MSISEKKSNPCLLWAWNDPWCPLGKIRQGWINGTEPDESELEALKYNAKTNPDIRIRETARTLLIAIQQPPGINPTADALHTKRTHAQIQRLLIPYKTNETTSSS